MNHLGGMLRRRQRTDQIRQQNHQKRQKFYSTCRMRPGVFIFTLIAPTFKTEFNASTLTSIPTASTSIPLVALSYE